MADIKDTAVRRIMRHQRVRKKVHGTQQRPRLVVFKSLKHLYAQVVDDDGQRTVTGASTLSPEIRKALGGKSRTERAQEVGKLIALRIKEKSIDEVIFDRNGYRYHGIVKALAEVVRDEKLLR
ncbi:50S ribosomal protein L18 [bacterium]|jgi:large subunit ribosomal protein L18|nr:50S ribosomal protein L18 [bacterium]